MLTNNQATNIARRHLRNPNIQLATWSQEQEGIGDSGMPVYRIQGYATDSVAYYLEGTPMRFDIRLSLANEG